MTAVLCRHFGMKYIEIAEDIASDTFLKASENWAINGIPKNPAAWLYTVAKNKTKDHFKRAAIFENQVRNELIKGKLQEEQHFEFDSQQIADSQLAMIFAVCNPANSAEAQICLALQILCGFSVEEIANAFLAKPETIKKRLLRARANLRNDSFQLINLTEADIKSRIETVLKTLYLVFNEGYFSKTNDQLIRKDLCSEAVRLALVLLENPLTNTPKSNALLALMCYQSSRLDARISHTGEAIAYGQQDSRLWDQSLIDRGNYYLINAFDGPEISKYHLEAGIAYWHSTPADETKWQHILQLYDQLMITAYSPIIALNRTFALAKVHGYEKAISEAEKLDMNDSNYYHQLLGYLYADKDVEKAIHHYRLAIKMTRSKVEQQTLMKEIKRLSPSDQIYRNKGKQF
ncbi:RNA polymerase subunit sigma [Pedobacter steynii]|nr:RNA polymerase subunit sigma [Pedobacter steynii]